MTKKSTNNKKKFGRYQKRLCLLLFISTWPNSFSGLQFLITHYTPPFCCANVCSDKFETNSSRAQYHFNNDTTSSSLDSNAPEESCWISNTSYTGKILNSSQEPCKEFQFDGPYITAVTEFQLVCDQAWIKPVLVSVYMVGKMAGGLTGGLLSDRYGRRFSFLVFTFLQYFVAIVSSFSTSISFYAVCLFFSGCCAIVNFDAALLLGTESVDPKHRSLMYFFVECGFAIGYMLLPLIGYIFPDWRWFLRFTGLIGLLYVPYWWLIDETPTWLLANGKTDAALKLTHKVAKVNKQPVEVNSEQLQFLRKDEGAGGTIWSACVETRQECVLVGRMGVMFFAWLIVTLTYYAIALNNDNLSGNRLLNIFFAGVIELASSICYFFGVNSLGRRNTYLGLMTTTGLAVALSPVFGLWNGTASLVMTMLAKLTVSICYNVIYVYTGELFPTNMRHSVLAISGAVSRIGGIASPFIIFAGESGDVLTTSFIMAALILISAMSFFFEPETKDENLPQTVQEARAMNRDLCISSCRGRKNDQDCEVHPIDSV